MSNISFTFRSHKQDTIDAKNLAVERALYAIGLEMEKNAKEELSKPKPHKTGESPRPNVDTGRLRNSIVFATETETGTGSAPAESSDYSPHATPEQGEVYVGTNVEYAPHIEFGTSRGISPYPFLRPAITEHIDDYKKILESTIKK